MRVLGVDSSLRCTGAALVQDGNLTVTRFPTERARTIEGQIEQTRYIAQQVLRFAPKQITLSVLEKPYVPQGQGGAGGLVERCGLFWLLLDRLATRGPVVVVKPTQRAKYGAHDGHADKKAVVAAIRAAFPSIRVRDDNEADAIALAAMGARQLGAPIDGEPSKKQSEVMAAVAWPISQRREQ